MKLDQALQQKKWRSEQQKAMLNVLFTASWMTGRISSILKPHGITHQQFNILRILKGQKGRPASVRMLADRMIDKMSNASRLVDKLKAKGLVERHECSSDRRRVDVVITEAGMRITEICSADIQQKLEENLGLNLEEAEALNGLLEKIRTNHELG